MSYTLMSRDWIASLGGAEYHGLVGVYAYACTLAVPNKKNRARAASCYLQIYQQHCTTE